MLVLRLWPEDIRSRSGGSESEVVLESDIFYRNCLGLKGA